MRLTGEEICAQLLDLEGWPSFRGFGPIPGIRSARFRRRTPEVVGTEIEVTNLDGSAHVETIAVWEPGREVVMRMAEFTPPLAGLATHTVETWCFEPDGSATRVTRSFELHPRGWLARIALVPIAWLLGRAAARHLEELDRV
jgi:hypothetical protein